MGTSKGEFLVSLEVTLIEVFKIVTYLFFVHLVEIICFINVNIKQNICFSGRVHHGKCN